MAKALRICLKGQLEAFFDVPMPDNLEDLGQISTALNINGYLLWPKLWVARDSVAYMLIVETPPGNGATVTPLRPVS